MIIPISENIFSVCLNTHNERRAPDRKLCYGVRLGLDRDVSVVLRGVARRMSLNGV